MPLPSSVGRMVNRTQVTPMIMLHSMATVKEFCRCKEGLKSVENELIKREMIWVGLL